ncbi:MAG: PH domain-containing protein [Synergistaceae bacterium]|nr:PH domain-containing protein [Synergistaceae bacterium]
METVYKPAWKSYYKEFLLMLLLLAVCGAVHYLKNGASWLKWMWIAACVVDVLVFIYVALRRATMSLILRDNPDSPANQEVAFVTCNPLKPWSSDFRRSIEIGLSNIMHIEVGQNLMQTMLGVGDIIITSSGTSGEEIRATNIPSPSTVRDTIQEHARKYTMA